MSKFLAFDFGADSGRAILGQLNDKRINLKEIHRFSNRPVKIHGQIYWDLLYLYDELRNGIAIAVKQGHKDLLGIGVDTWGVDFGLIGKKNQLLGNPFAYRDSRTDSMMEKAFERMPKKEIYKYTGIQFLQLNSIFQLLSMVESKNPLLDISETLLFMPDLFNFLLTGEKKSEYTIATTSQLLNAVNKNWEPAIFKKLNLPLDIMPSLIPPGTVIGQLLPDIAQEAGIPPVEVIAPGCHDTASAVAAVPAQSTSWGYISSGTWSLVGIEIDEPIINDDSLQNNFTNEGGIGQKIRFLRNTMGLWLLQRCQFSWKQAGQDHTWNELTNMATTASPFRSIIHPDDPSFLNPHDMPTAIAQFCDKNNQPISETKGQFVRCILESLALKYRFIIEKMNSMKEKPIEVLHIVGGGSQNEMLNQFAANATGLEVIAGPAEATATGNIMVQAIAKGELDSIQAGRELVARSFSLKHYTPENQEAWDEAYHRVKEMFL